VHLDIALSLKVEMNSTHNPIKDEDEIACIELDDTPISTDLDLDGNALSDRFDSDSLLSNVIDLLTLNDRINARIRYD
jgi:hypothetical protein